MTNEAINTLVTKLYKIDENLFFKKEVKNIDDAENKHFFIEIKKEAQEVQNDAAPGKVFNSPEIKYDYKYYELKDEYKAMVSNLSLTEIIQILNSNSNTENLSSIKKWVKFLGIVTIASVAAFIILFMPFILKFF